MWRRHGGRRDAHRVPSDRRLVLLAVVVGVVALVLVGRLLQGGGASARAPVAIPTVALATTADPALGPVTVYVVGAVRRPGVLVLPAGSRARDALRRAGGALPRADLAQLNLAVRLADGEMIVVPRRGAAAPGRRGERDDCGAGDRAPQLRDGRAARRARRHRSVARRAHRRLAHGARRLPHRRRSRPGRRHRARAPRGPPWTRRTVRLSPAASLLPSLPGWRCPRRSSPGRSAISAVQRSPVSQRCDCGCPAASAWSAPWWLWASVGSCRSRTCDRSRSDPLASEIGDPVHGRAVVTGSVIHGQWDQRAIARFRDADVLLRVAAPIETGDVVELEGRLRAPRGPTADGFDERTWLARQGVHEVLRARSAHVVGRRGGVWGLIDRVRNNARDALRVGGGDGEAVADGVLLGGNDGLTPDTRDAFRASGLGHLLAVSGQNVVLLVAAILVVCGCLGVARAPALGLAIAATVLYVLVVGPGASVVRAGITGVVVAVAWLANRPVARWHVLAVAAAGCLWLDPWAVRRAGLPAVVRRRRRDLRRGAADPALARGHLVSLAAARAARDLDGLHARDRADRVAAVRPRRARGQPAGEPRGAAGGRAAALDRYRRDARASARARGRGAARARRERTRRVPGRRRARRRADRPLRQRGRDRPRNRRPGDAARPSGSIARGTSSSRSRRWPCSRFAADLDSRQPTARRPCHRDAPRDVPRRGPGERDAVTASGFAALVDAGPADAHVARRLRELGVHRLDALVLSHPQADHVGGAAEVLDTVPVGRVLDPGLPSDERYEQEALAAARRHGVPVVVARTGLVLRRATSDAARARAAARRAGRGSERRRRDRRRGGGRLPHPPSGRCRGGGRAAPRPAAGGCARGRAPRLGRPAAPGAASSCASGHRGHLGGRRATATGTRRRRRSPRWPRPASRSSAPIATATWWSAASVSERHSMATCPR